ncbi:hypothetical protein ABOZ94_002167 [Salmonella enterica]|nr:hypothetical protein [Salmonella enterica]ECE0415900.1 hypothetical protein [Salmonella enterica]EJU1693266.1 hypothetical protein [Salmonella enterica]EKD5484939.1 hypothetical protein [Salmonella enterica subsp. arizonae]HDY3839157.1 hypothetical protein [Salmonella enterica]
MVAANINRKSAHQQRGVWQHTLQDYKTHMTGKKQQQAQQATPEAAKTMSAHRVKPCNGKTPQKPTSEPQQAKPKSVQERVRPEGSNFRHYPEKKI